MQIRTSLTGHQDMKKQNMRFILFAHADHGPQEETRGGPTYCKGILVDAATGCIFPRLRSYLQECLINGIIWHQTPFNTRLLADSMLPAKQILSGLGWIQ